MITIEEAKLMSDADARSLIRAMIISRASNPEDTSQILALAVKMFFADEEKQADAFAELDINELRKRAAKHLSNARTVS